MSMKRILLWVAPVLLFWGAPQVFASSSMSLHFIDAGEGESILILSPDGKAALVDAGNPVTGYKVAEYVREAAGKIERMIFTHPHFDHIGGAFFTLQMLEVANVHDNGGELSDLARENPVYRWYGELVRRNGRYRSLAAGDRFSLGEVEMFVLWPHPPRQRRMGANAESLVMRVDFKGFRCLLAGDLESAAEKEILDRPEDLRADVLKIAHHGAEDASSDEFLAAVSPTISVISVASRNPYGFPSPEVLGKLEAMKIKTYRTDRHGTVVIRVAPDGTMEVETEREAGANP
jgi:competence protein ComEC